jgi:hypothetical protein
LNCDGRRAAYLWSSRDPSPATLSGGSLRHESGDLTIMMPFLEEGTNSVSPGTCGKPAFAPIGLRQFECDRSSLRRNSTNPNRKAA